MSTSIYAPEIVLDIESQEIVPVHRKLKAIWSMEAAQDLRAWHNISAEKSLADLMAQEIANEIDKEILEDLARNAQEAAEAELRFKNRKKRVVPRSIDADWQVSRFD